MKGPPPPPAHHGAAVTHQQRQADIDHRDRDLSSSCSPAPNHSPPSCTSDCEWKKTIHSDKQADTD